MSSGRAARVRRGRRGALSRPGDDADGGCGRPRRTGDGRRGAGGGRGTGCGPGRVRPRRRRDVDWSCHPGGAHRAGSADTQVQTAQRKSAGSNSAIGMMRTRGSRLVKARTSCSRSNSRSPRAASAVNWWLRNSSKPDEGDPAVAAEQPADVVGEVAVVADEHDVGLAAPDLLQRALDGDVDDLLLAVAPQRDGAVVHRHQRLDEGHRQLRGHRQEEQAVGLPAGHPRRRTAAAAPSAAARPAGGVAPGSRRRASRRCSRRRRGRTSGATRARVDVTGVTTTSPARAPGQAQRSEAGTKSRPRSPV